MCTSGTSGKTFDAITFYKKRFFRIFPLLWLVTFVAILFSHKMPDLTDLVLNLTGLFGFLRWDVYFSTGVWSIGNELVFYTLFPLFLYAASRKMLWPWLLLLVAAIVHTYFAWILVDSHTALSDQWKSYVNPLNQVFFFIAGCMIGYLTKHRPISQWVSILFLAAGALLLAFYPAYGNTATLVTGANRWVFTLACVAMCAGFYKIDIRLPKVVHHALTLLGESSYSVYLLHPLVFIAFGFVFKQSEHMGWDIPNAMKFWAPFLVTLVASYVVYTYFERYFMKLGRHSSPGSPS